MNVKKIVKRIISYIVAFIAGVFSVVLFIFGRRSNEDRTDNSNAARNYSPTEDEYRRVESAAKDALEIIRTKKDY